MRIFLNLALNGPRIAQNFRMRPIKLSLGRQCGANRKIWEILGWWGVLTSKTLAEI